MIISRTSLNDITTSPKPTIENACKTYNSNRDMCIRTDRDKDIQEHKELHYLSSSCLSMQGYITKCKRQHIDCDTTLINRIGTTIKLQLKS